MICPKCHELMSEVHVFFGEDIYHCSPCGDTAYMAFCPLGICPNQTVLKDN